MNYEYIYISPVEKPIGNDEETIRGKKNEYGTQFTHCWVLMCDLLYSEKSKTATSKVKFHHRISRC